MDNMTGIYVGTSGWSYDSWKKVFYPEKLAKVKYLDHYAARFSSVEMNSVFYQMPTPKAVAQFARAVPETFVFSVRANRYITHIKRLNDGRKTLPPFLSRMEMLGDKLGPILLQVPPNLGFNRDRLKSILGALPPERRFVFEFHDMSWFNEITYEALKERNAALGIFQVGERITPRVTTADFAYIRLHRPAFKDMETMQGLLDTWAKSIQDWSGSGKDVFCYFDQVGEGCVAEEALQFRDLLAKAIGTRQPNNQEIYHIDGFAGAPPTPVQPELRAQ